MTSDINAAMPDISNAPIWLDPLQEVHLVELEHEEPAARQRRNAMNNMRKFSPATRQQSCLVLSHKENVQEVDIDIPLTLDTLARKNSGSIVLTFAEYDTENPYNWNKWYRRSITTMINPMTLFIGLAITVYSSGINSMVKDLNSLGEEGQLGLSTSLRHGSDGSHPILRDGWTKIHLCIGLAQRQEYRNYHCSLTATGVVQLRRNNPGRRNVRRYGRTGGAWKSNGSIFLRSHSGYRCSSDICWLH